jgi:putative folate metabolism gamma-glutamate ligase
MKITVIRTDRVTSKSHELFEILDKAIPKIEENSIVAVAAKIVSLCEGRVVAMSDADKDTLIKQESQQFLPRSLSRYNVSFTITHNMLLPTAGIDESNANDHYILWPKDLQASANAIREHLVSKHGITNVGVIITDSTTRPLQWGTTGVALASSGFEPLKDYIGTADIFGRELQFQKSNIANGLAAAAVTMMGEGNEQTPIALIEDAAFVKFQGRNPTPEEIEALVISPQDDLYAPLIDNAPWQKGDQPLY